MFFAANNSDRHSHYRYFRSSIYWSAITVPCYREVIRNSPAMPLVRSLPFLMIFSLLGHISRGLQLSHLYLCKYCNYWAIITAALLHHLLSVVELLRADQQVGTRAISSRHGSSPFFLPLCLGRLTDPSLPRLLSCAAICDRNNVSFLFRGYHLPCAWETSNNLASLSSFATYRSYIGSAPPQRQL